MDNSSAGNPPIEVVGAAGTVRPTPSGGRKEAVAGKGGVLRSRSPRLFNDGGVRIVKTYALHESELNELSSLQGIGTFFISAASACGGFALSCAQQLAFAGSVAADIQAEWAAYQTISSVLTAVLVVLALVYRVKGHRRLDAIKKATAHKP